jgi:cytochrome d ubiquinol oxidase subunit I
MNLDAAFLSRLQFGLTIGFHYIFPVITIGVAWLIVWMQTAYLRTGDEIYRTMTRFWIRVFAVSFAVGVATGITMEFQFGMNWARYSRFVGDIFGAPLAAEGIFAFFLESSFLGILLFGEKRVSSGVYWLSGFLVALGATLSAFWIVVANSWQQTPAGFRIVDGRAQLVDFWAAVFNPSTVPRFLHTVNGALIAGSFFVLGLSAWLLLRDKGALWARKSLTIALVSGALSSSLEIPLGHFHAVQVAETQPAKLAVMEGLWETQTNAPLLIFGLPNPDKERTDYAVGLPGWLSIGIGGTRATEVRGLKSFPLDERPPILPTFFSFHVMVGLGFYFVGLTALGLFLWWRKRLFDNRLFLRLAFYSIPLPIIANELGWFTAEVGRQPWVVQGLLRTSDAFSEIVPAGQILFSIIGFMTIYALLFVLWIHILKKLLLRGAATAPREQEVSA